MLLESFTKEIDKISIITAIIFKYRKIDLNLFSD